MSISKDTIEQNKVEVIRLLSGTRRQGIDDLVEWLEDETDFFSSPASSRIDRHGCYEGGLAEHSLNVYQLFSERASELGLGIKKDEVTIASLLHDLCKVNMYTPKAAEKVRASDKKMYDISDSFPLGHGEKSVYYAMRYIRLTDKEALLIRWHMGSYDPSWEKNINYVERVCPEIQAFHHCDHDASLYLDGKE